MMGEITGSLRTGQVVNQQPQDTVTEQTQKKGVLVDARPDSNLSGRQVGVPKQSGFKGFLGAVKALFTRKADDANLNDRDVQVPKKSKFKAFFKAIADFFRGGPKLTPDQAQNKALVDKMTKNAPPFLKDAITSGGPKHYEGDMTGKPKDIVMSNYQSITDDFGDLTDDGVTVSSVFQRDVVRGMAKNENFMVTDLETGRSISMGKVENSDNETVSGFIEYDRNGNKTVKEGDCRDSFLELVGKDKDVAKHLSFYMSQTLPLTMLEGASNLPCFVGDDGKTVGVNGAGNIPMKHHAMIDGDRIILKTSISGNLANIVKNDENEQFMAFLKSDTSNIDVGWTIELKLDDLREGNGKFTVLEDLHYTTDIDVDWTMTRNMNE